MEWFFLWVAFSVAVGFYANSKGRSGVGFFALSLLLSPLIGLIAAAIALPRRSVQDERRLEFSDDLRKCPFCAELIKKEAIKCRYCGSELPGQPKSTATVSTDSKAIELPASMTPEDCEASLRARGWSVEQIRPMAWRLISPDGVTLLRANSPESFEAVTRDILLGRHTQAAS